MEKSKDINQGNKLIAVFDGLIYNDFLKVWTNPNRKGWKKYKTEECKYHSSWDWLMPVVDKIEQVDVGRIYKPNFIIYPRMGCVNFNSGTIEDIAVTGATRIEAAYQTVIQFIQWLNTNSKEGSKL